MRKLALRDEILLQIDKAARYIGGEVNAVMKNKEDVDIRFAMAFPDVYEIGMSNLGMMILYDMFNKRDDVWCERLFSPWTDLDKIMREEHIPLFTLESQDPVKEFDFLGITLGYEMCYTNVLQLLDLSGIPLLATERTEDDPLVIGGGACAYNPEPLAPFFDHYYIGEGEMVYGALFDAYKANQKAGGSRQDFLLKAAQETLGDKAMAITACPCAFTDRELKETEDFCQDNHICQEVCRINEFDIPGFRQNPPDRCYICKKAIFTKL